MVWFGAKRKPEVRQASIENPTVPVSSDNFLAFFGLGSVNLPRVTTISALSVPAVAAAVTFLSRTLAALPLDAKRRAPDGGETAVTGKIQSLVHDYANDEMDGFKFRQYFWQQVFTGGRGLAWIERVGNTPVALWPMDPARVTIRRELGKLVYRWEGQTYAASEVIDVAFMLRQDMILHYGPIALAGKAIQLALAMNDYGSNFFAGGGVPPLSLEGPLAAGEGLKRAQSDIKRAIDAAKNNGEPVFPIPAGYKLNPVGFDPAKGQMLEARLFQVQEIARAFQIPPNFLQDLSKASFANVEQNDLYLVKHLVSQWAKALEGEMSLKLFGRTSKMYVEHDLDGLLRGDFLSRMDGFAKAIQSGQITPNEARAENGRSKHSNPAADQLLIQSATIVLGAKPEPSAPIGHNGGPPLDDNADNPPIIDNGDGNDNNA